MASKKGDIVDLTLSDDDEDVENLAPRASAAALNFTKRAVASVAAAAIKQEGAVPPVPRAIPAQAPAPPAPPKRKDGPPLSPVGREANRVQVKKEPRRTWGVGARPLDVADDDDGEEAWDDADDGRKAPDGEDVMELDREEALGAAHAGAPEAEGGRGKRRGLRALRHCAILFCVRRPELTHFQLISRAQPTLQTWTSTLSSRARTSRLSRTSDTAALSTRTSPTNRN